MNTKSKTRKTKQTAPAFVPVSFREVYGYQDKFVEWLERQGGKQAKAAFYGLQYLDIASRNGVTEKGQKEVMRARRSLQKFLGYTFTPEDGG